MEMVVPRSTATPSSTTDECPWSEKQEEPVRAQVIQSLFAARALRNWCCEASALRTTSNEPSELWEPEMKRVFVSQDDLPGYAWSVNLMLHTFFVASLRTQSPCGLRLISCSIL